MGSSIQYVPVLFGKCCIIWCILTNRMRAKNIHWWIRMNSIGWNLWWESNFIQNHLTSFNMSQHAEFWQSLIWHSLEPLFSFHQPVDGRSLRVGMLCVALFGEDELYYRARIVSFRDKHYLEVKWSLTVNTFYPLDESCLFLLCSPRWSHYELLLKAK